MTTNADHVELEGLLRLRWAEIKELKAENERLKAALRDCADELESYVEHHYKDTKDYPSELRRYERDIEPVRKARDALGVKP